MFFAKAECVALTKLLLDSLLLYNSSMSSSAMKGGTSTVVCRGRCNQWLVQRKAVLEMPVIKKY